MAILTNLLHASVAFFALVGAGPIERRGEIGHNEVVGFAEAVPAGDLGRIYQAYQPFLKVLNGCVPFPAVDAAGNFGGGLKPSGTTNGGCSSHASGQIYARAVKSGAYWAIMYSWYFPKDSPSPFLGHRHDWEGVIVWLKSEKITTAANIAAVCPSAHGEWKCAKTGFSLSGTGPLLDYEAIAPGNHALGLTNSVGGQQALIAWESMTDAARASLNNVNFDKAIVPFKSGTFWSNLAKATF